MSDFKRFEKALQAAEAAGDVEGARALAVDMRRFMQAQNPSLGRPEDPRIEASKMAAKGMGIPETLAVGAGRTFDKLGAGIRHAQLGSVVSDSPSWLPQVPAGLKQEAGQRMGTIESEQADKNIAYRGLEQERPFASAIGGALPYAAATVPSAGLLGSSALIGAGSAMEYGTPEERATRGALGFGTSLVGGAVGRGIGGVVASGRGLPASQRSGLNAGGNLGIRPRLSQVTGNKTIEGLEDWASRVPGGRGVMDKFAQNNQQAVNRAASKSIGENADELSPEVFARARARIVKPFEDIKNLPGRPITITPSVGATAEDILKTTAKMTPGQKDANLISLAEQAKAMAANKGRIDGEAYQLLRSGLSEAAFDATGTNKALYGRLLEAVDDAAEQSLKAAGQSELAAALKVSRPQYKNLLTLERGLVAEGGNVSPARLGQGLRTQNPAAFREGRMKGNPLYDIARYGESFKPLQQGSQTFERTWLGNPVASIVGALPAYAIAKATTSPLMTFYPRHIGSTQAAGLLGQGLNPAVRGGTMGLLQSPESPIAPFLMPFLAQ